WPQAPSAKRIDVTAHVSFRGHAGYPWAYGMGVGCRGGIRGGGWGRSYPRGSARGSVVGGFAGCRRKACLAPTGNFCAFASLRLCFFAPLREPPAPALHRPCFFVSLTAFQKGRHRRNNGLAHYVYTGQYRQNGNVTFRSRIPPQ